MNYLFVLGLLGSSVAWAQSEYPAGTIPDALKENAHAVIRRHEMSFSVKSPGEATHRIRTVITVLDNKGDDQATRVVGYNKLSKITEFSGALYDAGGVLIRKLKKADIEDRSTYTDYNFFDDQRLRAAQFPKQPGYPYTVEFVVETSERNLMFYPTWMPQNEQHLSLELATFRVNMPAGLALRYKEMNLPEAGVLTPLADGGKSYTWQLTNRPAVEFEPLSPPAREQLPIVYTAPTTFEVQQYKGNLATWRDLGQFYHILNAGRDQIPDGLRQQVADLVRGESTTAAKVAALYRFLQTHTRYVSIQLGIGGWQTIEASQVASSQYGDCKALTNYAGALLKAVGITAYPALVRAGDEEPDALVDFPAFQFNHVILCVPDGRDTTFLECTSGYDPVGYLGNFTGNRHVLLVTPDGGRLITTPAYQPADNLQQRRIVISLSPEGHATADVRTRYTGLQHNPYASALRRLNRDELRSWLLERIRIPAFELISFAYDQQPTRIPAIRERLALAAQRWATVSGTRLFLPLNLMSSLPPATPLTQPRKTPLVLGADYDFDDSDTIIYQLPKGYVPEYRLDPLTVESKFGRYSAQATVEGERVTYVRRVTMHRGRFAAPAYADWVDFRQKIARADRAQMVFVKMK